MQTLKEANRDACANIWASLLMLVVKNLPANAGDVRTMDLIPGSIRSPGEGNKDLHFSVLIQYASSLQYSCLENPMDRRAWRATVHRVSNSQIWLKWLSKQASKRVIYLTALTTFLGSLCNDMTGSISLGISKSRKRYENGLFSGLICVSNSYSNHHRKITGFKNHGFNFWFCLLVCNPGPFSLGALISYFYTNGGHYTT